MNDHIEPSAAVRPIDLDAVKALTRSAERARELIKKRYRPSLGSAIGGGLIGFGGAYLILPIRTLSGFVGIPLHVIALIVGVGLVIGTVRRRRARTRELDEILEQFGIVAPWKGTPHG